MAKQPKQKAILRDYWCRPGNHRCSKLDLCVQYGQSCFGICRACIQKQTKGEGLKNYWQDM